MKERMEQLEPISRRNMLKGSAFLLAGGIVGGLGAAYSAKESAAKTATAPDAPPLPWEWVKLDSMEAGRRAYRAYHSDKG